METSQHSLSFLDIKTFRTGNVNKNEHCMVLDNCTKYEQNHHIRFDISQQTLKIYETIAIIFVLKFGTEPHSSLHASGCHST